MSWQRGAACPITGLEQERVDLTRNTTCLNQTKNGTPRGVPLDVDAVQVLREQLGKHPRFVFTHRGNPIRWEVTNLEWYGSLTRAGIKDFRFHTCGTRGLLGLGRRERPATS